MRQWSLEDGAQKLRIHEPHRGAVTAMALVPDAPSRETWGRTRWTRRRRPPRRVRGLTAGEDGFVAVWAVDANDAVAGATLAAQNAQRANAYVATEFQRKQERLAAREPELRRADMAVKPTEGDAGAERAKFPGTRKLKMVKGLEDMTAKELEVMTSAELITCCLAHGLLCVNPKTPPALSARSPRRWWRTSGGTRTTKIRMRQERPFGRRDAGDPNADDGDARRGESSIMKIRDAPRAALDRRVRILRTPLPSRSTCPLGRRRRPCQGRRHPRRRRRRRPSPPC